MDILPELLTTYTGDQSALAARSADALAATPRPTVSAVLNEWGPWGCWALLGMCEDGYPLSARWTQPKRSSHYLYLAGDEATLTTLVEPMLYSIAYQRNILPKVADWPDAAQYTCKRDHIRYAIVSPSSTWWRREITKAEHHAGIAPPESEDARKLLTALQATMYARFQGSAKSPDVQIIIVLHDLGKYWRTWDNEAWEAWGDILAHGHQVGIHLVATLQYSHLTAWEFPLPNRRLYGSAAGKPLPNLPTVRDLAAMGISNLPTHVGLTRCGGRWQRFVAPSVG